MSYEWINYEFPIQQLFHKQLLWVSANCNIYFALKKNIDDAWSWYSGNSSHALESGNLLTSCATEALAQTNYLTTSRDTNGKVLAILPTVVQAKYIRMYIEVRDAVTIYEWRPSTYFTADEIVSGELHITDSLSDAPKIRVTKSNVDRIKIGNITGSTYGIAGYDSNAATIFELSDAHQTIAGWDFTASNISKNSLTLSSDGKVRALNSSNYIEMSATGIRGYDNTLGRTFWLPTTGSIPEFVRGRIKEVTFTTWNTGKIEIGSGSTEASINPKLYGGLSITATKMTGYNTSGALRFQTIYSGTNQGDVTIGNYSENKGLKWDQSAEKFDIKGEISLTSSSLLLNALVIREGGFIKTGVDYPYIEINSEGIKLKDSDPGGTYGTALYGTDKYGYGALAWILNNDIGVPWAELKEPQNILGSSLASMRFFNRDADPTGKSEIGDIAVTNKSMRICQSAGTPGTYKLIGPMQAAFQARKSGAQSNITTGTWVDVTWDTEVFDKGADFGSSTFTAPETNLYSFNVHLALENIDNAASYYGLRLRTSNRDYLSKVHTKAFVTNDTLYFPLTLNVLADMDLNDTAKVSVWQEAGGAQTDIGTDSFFSGMEVSTI